MRSNVASPSRPHTPSRPTALDHPVRASMQPSPAASPLPASGAAIQTRRGGGQGAAAHTRAPSSDVPPRLVATADLPDPSKQARLQLAAAYSFRALEDGAYSYPAPPKLGEGGVSVTATASKLQTAATRTTTRFAGSKPEAASASGGVGDYLVNSFSFKDIVVSYPGKAKGEPRKTVLHNISGHFTRGDLVALLGPSGSGKTTLLSVLSKQKFRSSAHVSGDVMVDNQLVDDKKLGCLASYVAQEDAFFPTQTVREVLLFHARMKLRRTHTLAEQEILVDELLAGVGLAGQAGTKIGGVLPGGLVLRGISGGEKRRLSLATGILQGPQILFADEPTSGLDSFSALRVMALLQELSASMVVVCTIHQPRQAIWDMFDKVLVLSIGYPLYCGPADTAVDWFSGLGYAMPPNTSPADFIMDLCNVSFVTGGAAEAKAAAAVPAIDMVPSMGSVEQVKDAARAFRESEVYASCVAEQLPQGPVPELGLSDGMSGIVAYARRWFARAWYVLCRNSVSYARNPGNVMMRAAATVLEALLMGMAYVGTGGEAATTMDTAAIGDVTGSLFFSVMVLMLNAFCSISLFIFDRTYYTRENKAGLYTPGVYFIVNLFLEFWVGVFNGVIYSLITYYMIGYTSPFVAYTAIVCVHITASAYIIQFCALVAPNQDAAFAIGVAYTALATLSSGQPVAYPTTSAITRALQWVSLLKYAFQGLALNTFPTDSAGYAVLAERDQNVPGTAFENVLAMGAFYVVFGALSYLSLKYLNQQKA